VAVSTTITLSDEEMIMVDQWLLYDWSSDQPATVEDVLHDMLRWIAKHMDRDE
jgi:hypothetical protein